MTVFLRGKRPRASCWKEILILFLFGFIAALGVGEVAVRIIVALSNRVPLVVSDSQTGWVLRSKLRNQVRAEDRGQFVIGTDAEGHRLTDQVGKPLDGTAPAVIMVGDSFVQGNGVDDGQTFAWLLAREVPLKVVNLGVLGYGTDQELISLDTYLKSHSNLDVRDIVVLVSDNDFIDVQVNYNFNLGRGKPRFRFLNSRFEPEPFELGFSDRLMDVSYLYWLLYSKGALMFANPHPDPAAGIDVVAGCLGVMRDIAKQRGARLHVLAHHRLRGPEPFAAPLWEEFLRRSGATDITERIRTRGGPDSVGYDGAHWSVDGHRRVAAIVKELLDDPTRVPTPVHLTVPSTFGFNQHRTTPLE